MISNVTHSFLIPYGFEEVPLTYGSEVRGAFVFLNLAGYLPVIGTITGLFRMTIGASGWGGPIIASSGTRGPKEIQGTIAYGISMILRGSVELLSAGIIFLPIDLIVHATRDFFKNKALQRAHLN